jgi:pyruvate dehydrogenase E2 component (dihydrolipoamide acetyltransferase)
MASVIRMPEVLAGATEAVLAKWMISEGQDVAVGDVLAEIETEKANVDYQAEEQGTLARVLIQPGQSVEVGTPIAVFSAAGETADDVDAALAAAGGDVTPAESAPEAVSAPAPVAVASEAPVVAAPTSGRIYVSPLVRKRAREAGIDLSLVTGTGPGGRIVKKDLEAFLASGGATEAVTEAPLQRTSTPADVTGEAGYTDRPHTGMRRAVARRLTESKTTVPHFYVTADCRVDKLLRRGRR